MSKRKILITGKGSYVGTNFIKWLEQWPDQYEVVELSVRGTEWKEHDFSNYDVVLHVAGIAHRKETKKNVNLYYKVNRDLVFEVASQAKSNGVKQFIFLSSMSVYGIESGVIDNKSLLKPKTNYGITKLQAEKMILEIEDNSFKVVILRPPIIYGDKCKGNYPKLAKIAIRVKVFPNFNNERSMLHIDNLSQFIKLLIDDSSRGTFFPQNEEYVNTSQLVKLISETHGKQIRLTKVFNLVLRNSKIRLVNKVFGNLVYDKKMSEYKKNYYINNFKSSIILTERDNEIEL